MGTLGGVIGFIVIYYVIRVIDNYLKEKRK
jgi:hypothetical protein